MNRLLLLFTVLTHVPNTRLVSATAAVIAAMDVKTVPIELLLAVEEHESGFVLTSKNGPCCGLGQVDYRYSKFTCAEMRSNPYTATTATVNALLAWRRHAGTWRRTLSCYATGYKCLDTEYTDKVVEIWGTNRKALKKYVKNL